jgi:glutamate formiminotransferase/formiminotetrahydrofolate cyclodeaminase
VIGARQFLIAYNVYLTTSDVSISKNIAKAIRQSSGGMRFVKALGLLCEDRAQVSINLTNFHETPVARVMEMVRREASRYGVTVHHSELVGLIPEAALIDAAVWYLQLDQFEPDQILEHSLEAALQRAGETTMSVPLAFLDALAAGTPAPGGGSASAYSGAAAAALVAMVARLTIGKKKYVTVEERMRAILKRAESLRLSLTAAVDEDAKAFEAVIQAYKLPKGTTEEEKTREQVIVQATLQASRVPLKVARQAVEVLELAVEVVATGNLNAISDGASGAAQARAALDGAGYNVRINALNLKDRTKTDPLLKELRELQEKADNLEKKLRLELKERGGMPLE